MDSLQNALNAFQAQEGLSSRLGPSSSELPTLSGASGPELPPGAGLAGVGAGGLRPRRRKPPRGNSSFLLRTADSLPDVSLTKLGITV